MLHLFCVLWFLPLALSDSFKTAVTDITFVKAAPVSGMALDQVAPFLGLNPGLTAFADVEWYNTNLDQSTAPTADYLACVDGRTSYKCLSVPGGDMGAFIAALAAYQAVGGNVTTDQQVFNLFSAYVTNYTGSTHTFYMHTDDNALARLTTAAFLAGQWTPANFLSADPSLQPNILSALSSNSTDSYLGCSHLRLLFTNAAAYGVTQSLVQAAIKAFFQFAWQGPASQSLLTFESLGPDSAHKESAWLEIRGFSDNNPTFQPRFAHSATVNAIALQAFVFTSRAFEGVNTKMVAKFMNTNTYSSQLYMMEQLHVLNTKQLIAPNQTWYTIDVNDRSDVIMNVSQAASQIAAAVFAMLWIITMMALFVVIGCYRAVICDTPCARKCCPCCAPEVPYQDLQIDMSAVRAGGTTR